MQLSQITLDYYGISQYRQIIDWSITDQTLSWKIKRIVACHFDTKINMKDKEKIEVCQDLKRGTKRMWNVKEVKIEPIIIGALGTIGKSLDRWLKKIEIEYSIELLQKACLLGTAKIIRNVLNT